MSGKFVGGGRVGIRKWIFTNDIVVFLESIFTLVIVWALLAHGFDLVSEISSPILVGKSLQELLISGDWIPHFIATTRRIIFGFVVTLVIGTVLGILMGISNFGEKAFQDYVTVGLALPDLFAAVFAAMWFGVGDLTPTVAGSLIAFPFMTQNVYEGVKDIDTELYSMSAAFDVERNRVLRRVVVKSILPEWFAGARYAFALCWKVTTLAELVAAESGLGYMIQIQLRALSITGIITWTLLFTAFILIVEYGVFQQIEKRMFDWRQEVTIGFA